MFLSSCSFEPVSVSQSFGSAAETQKNRSPVKQHFLKLESEIRQLIVRDTLITLTRASVSDHSDGRASVSDHSDGRVMVVRMTSNCELYL